MKLNDLKKLAKERGLCGYSRFKKAELLSLLRPIPAPRSKRRDFSERPIPAPRNILNIRNPEINVPILIPGTVKAKPNVVKRVVAKTVNTFNDWLNWLAESGKNIVKTISPKLKHLKEKISKIFEEKFEVKEGESALRKFARQFTIDGKSGFVPQAFLDAVRNLVLRIFRDNKNTKVKLILKCKMQRTDLVTSRVDEVDADFSSEISKEQMKRNYMKR